MAPEYTLPGECTCSSVSRTCVPCEQRNASHFLAPSEFRSYNGYANGDVTGRTNGGIAEQTTIIDDDISGYSHGGINPSTVGIFSTDGAEWLSPSVAPDSGVASQDNSSSIET